MNVTILGIESSCDDTSAAVVENGYLLSNKIANQQVHKEYGGVVPELGFKGTSAKYYSGCGCSLKEAGKEPPGY